MSADDDLIAALAGLLDDDEAARNAMSMEDVLQSLVERYMNDMHSAQALKAYWGYRAWEQACDDQRQAKEREGYRLIVVDEDAEGSWELKDYRTGELLATGTNDSDLDSAWDALSADRALHNAELAYQDVEMPGVPETPGLPPGLGHAIDEWMDDPDVITWLGVDAME